MHRYSRSEFVPFASCSAAGARRRTRRGRYGVLRLAGALAFACAALLAAPMAAHGGPNDATLDHFVLKDSSGKILPLVRPFDRNKTRHYAYYTTYDSLAVVEAIPRDRGATVRFTRRPIFLESLPDGRGVKGTYHVPYGENRWTVVVTSANGRSTRQYAIYTRRFGPESNPFRTGNAHSRNANLELLQVGEIGSNSSQQLDPPLRTNLSVEDLQPARNRTYTVTVPHDQDQAWVRAHAADGDATVAISLRGATGSPGSTNDRRNFDLDYGENPVRITVTPDNRVWARVHRVKIVRQRPPGYSGELTATLTDLGIETEAQEGLLARTFELALSEPVRMPVSELKNHALSVDGGVLGKVTRVGGTSRLVNGRWVQYTDRWRIRVIIKQGVTLTVAGNRACHLDGALCTDDGRRLDGSPSVTLASAEQLKVSMEPEAVGDEDDGRIDFNVTLSRAARKLVRVRFRTIDSGSNRGTATPNVDYLPADYTVEFGPGETTKTAPVALYDDNIDDDGETVTVAISDARMILNLNGRSRAIAMAAPTRVSGTIRNSDPMPREWISRFGRTVADQVIDAVEGRMRASPAPGVEVSVAGQRIGGGKAAPRLAALSAWFRGGEERERAHGFRSRAVTGREILTGTSFAFAGGSAETGFGALWGRGAVSGFDGREGALTLDGEVGSAMLGADWTDARGAVGLMLSHSRGEGGYRSARDGGEVSSTLTGIYPYGRYDMSDGLSLWGVAGLGRGSLTLTQKGADPIGTDIGLAMAALGSRGILVEAPADGGFELAAASDATWVRTASDEVRRSTGNLAAAADVTRLRLRLQGAWRGPGPVAPSFEIGVRRDGGDAETGFGADIGAGLAWSDPASGIKAAVNARGLLTHESEGFRERGFSGSLAWDPTPETARGLKLTTSQTLGAQATEGADALFGRNTLAGLAANGRGGSEFARRRFEMKLGYGLAAFGGRFTGTPEIGFGFSGERRDYSLGWRLVRDRRRGGIGSLEFSVEARRGESADDNADPEHALGFKITARW